MNGVCDFFGFGVVYGGVVKGGDLNVVVDSFAFDGFDDVGGDVVGCVVDGDDDVFGCDIGDILMSGEKICF